MENVKPPRTRYEAYLYIGDDVAIIGMDGLQEAIGFLNRVREGGKAKVYDTATGNVVWRVGKTRA
jgi:hypothetical protein